MQYADGACHTARDWSYENIDGPTYDTMPAVPILQRRFEDMFIPRPVPSSSSALPNSAELTEPFRLSIAIDSLHTRDVEYSRLFIREVARRSGVHEGCEGTWIEMEWEVYAIPERKRLFLFASGREAHLQ